MIGYASTPADVESILSDPASTVRPASEPVPAPLIGTRLGEVMMLLPRFTDGESHRRNRIVSERLIRALEVQALARHVDRALANARNTTIAYDWMIAICPLTLAHALGVATDDLVSDVSALARGLGPRASDRDLAAAVDGCEHLWRATSRVFSDRAECSAVVGLLFQGFDSVSALIGNGLVANARSVGEVRRLIVDTPPIRTTRRFDSGDRPVTVDLEAATKATGGMPSYAFGFGPHRCPGQVLAFTIAAQALAHAPRLATIPEPLAFLPYPNANVPDLRTIELDWSTA